MSERLIRESDVIDNIDKWLETVGYATIGKNLSYYAELKGCIEDAPTVEAESKWISVKDRLPEEDTDVLIFSRKFKICTIGRCMKSSWGRWWTTTHAGCANITHWMPLPKPPKGEW